MINKYESECVLNPVIGAVDPAASPGARRADGDAAGSAISKPPADAGMEVVAHAQRRTFTTAERRRILEAADRCSKPGEIGALLRREGVYSSSLCTWRRQREAADLAALAPQKRGPKVDPNRAEAQQIAQLTRENERLKHELDMARLVIEVQKKVAALLGTPIDDKPGNK
jgi:transposase-like protein